MRKDADVMMSGLLLTREPIGREIGPFLQKPQPVIVVCKEYVTCSTSALSLIASFSVMLSADDKRRCIWVCARVQTPLLPCHAVLRRAMKRSMARQKMGSRSHSERAAQQEASVTAFTTF